MLLSRPYHVLSSTKSRSAFLGLQACKSCHSALVVATFGLGISELGMHADPMQTPKASMCGYPTTLIQVVSSYMHEGLVSGPNKVVFIERWSLHGYMQAFKTGFTVIAVGIDLQHL